MTELTERAFQAMRNTAAWDKYLESMERESDYGIGAIAPVGGRVEGPYGEFNWLPLDHLGIQYYRFKIWNFESKQVILETRVSGTKLGLQIEDLLVDQGETYLWQAEAVLDERYDDIANVKTIQTPPTEFLYTPEKTIPLKQALRSLPLYADLPISCQYFLLASALESDEHHSTAFYVLRTWLEEEPENLLAARCYATFLARRGHVDMVDEWMEGE